MIFFHNLTGACFRGMLNSTSIGCDGHLPGVWEALGHSFWGSMFNAIPRRRPWHLAFAFLCNTELWAVS